MDLEIAKELRELKKDELNSSREIERITNRMAFLLRGEMGNDIKDVISGKVKVKLSLKEKINYKIKNFVTKLLNIFY